MKLGSALICILFVLYFSGCAPKTQSRDEAAAVAILSQVKHQGVVDDDRPFLITLKSVSANLEPVARERILANIHSRECKFVDALLLDPRRKFGQREMKPYRTRVTFGIISWISENEVIIKSSTSIGGGINRWKRINGVLKETEVIESWVS